MTRKTKCKISYQGTAGATAPGGWPGLEKIDPPGHRDLKGVFGSAQGNGLSAARRVSGWCSSRTTSSAGFWIGNVIVMAGVPSIMEAMVYEVAPKLKIGVRILSETVRADAREGDFGM